MTGASSGIGRAAALELARRGANVVLAARRREKLDAVAAECAAMGVSATAVTTDVTRREDCIRLIETAGAVDVLVNNAGFAVLDAVERANLDDWNEMMQTNYFGTVHCTHAALPGMLERGSGAIVNVSSIAGLMGYAHMAGYSASKFAVVGFSESLRNEVIGRGVRVAVVCPGTTESEFFVRAERQKIPAAYRLVVAVPAERVARTICDAAEDGAYRRIVPFASAVYMRFKELFPQAAHALVRSVSSAMERK